jgi:hypothetical protein
MSEQSNLNLCDLLAPLCMRGPCRKYMRECFIKFIPRRLLEAHGLLFPIGYERFMPLCGLRQIPSYLCRQPAK